jgi:hypothetical protein
MNTKKRMWMPEQGASDTNIILLLIGVSAVLSAVIWFNSCVRDHNRRKRGWVERPVEDPVAQQHDSGPASHFEEDGTSGFIR